MATIELPLRDELLNSQGNLHGGVTASIADEAAWHAMISHYGQRNATTTELKVNYLRPIVGKKVIARAYMLKAGATLCVSGSLPGFLASCLARLRRYP